MISDLGKKEAICDLYYLIQENGEIDLR